jgi:uncharacterized protein YneF (UPF0154 family)
VNSSDILAERIKKVHSFCRLYIFAGLFAARFLSAMLFCGVAIILLRYFELPVLFNGICVGLLVLLAFALAFRKAFSHKLELDDIAGWLDGKTKAGGLLMAYFECRSLPGWEERIERLKLPEAKADWRKTMLSFCAGIVFVFVCWVIPLPAKDVNVVPAKLDISSQTKELNREIDSLENAGAVDEEQRKRLEDIIKELENNTAALQPGKIYESLDAVESAVKDMGDNAAGSLMSGSNLMKQMEMAVQELETGNNSETEERLRKFAESLTKMLQNSPCLSSNCFKMKGGLKADQTMSAILNRPPPVDEKTLKKLANFLKQSQSKIKKSLRSMCQNGACSRQAQALREFLKNNKGLSATSGRGSELWLTKAMEEAMKKNGQGFPTPEYGSISRGRGDAPMIFGQESPKLVQGSFDKVESDSLNMKVGASVGISFAAPEVKPIDDKGQGALASGVGSGGQARRHRVSPKHKDLLKRYFKNN